MNAVPISGDTPSAWTRLLVACGLSLVLHLVLLLGVSVNPAGDHATPGPLISARLEPAAEELPDQAASTVTVAEQAVPIVPEPVVIPAEEPRAEPTPKTAALQPQLAPAAPPAGTGSGVELPLNRDPTYYTTKELHVLPKPLAQSEDYMKAEVARLDARVRVLLLIDELGVVTEASVVEAQPPGNEEAVRAVFAALRFSPGMIEGRAVKARVLMNARPLPAGTADSIR